MVMSSLRRHGRQNERRPLLFLALLALALLIAALPVFGQQGNATGTLTGTLVDTSGASIADTQVKLSLEGRGPDQETRSGKNGGFSFSNVAPGAYHLSFSAKDFAAKTISGMSDSFVAARALNPGLNCGTRE